MSTQAQIKTVEKNLKEYKKRFLIKKYENLDEASTRLMVNSFLVDILGYIEFEEIKTEYRIAGEYADYVIQIGRKKHFIIEVKSAQIDLTEKHLRQATNYAANEGIDWVLLTNGNSVALYRVIFNKPISSKKVFEYNIAKESNLKKIASDVSFLTKKSVTSKKLDKYWERFEVVEPAGLSKLLYNKDVVSAIRRSMKQKAGLTFSEEEVLDALYYVITKPIESVKMKKPIEKRQKSPKKIIREELQNKE